MPGALHVAVVAAVLALSAYSLLKFAFFFLLPYKTRRVALDRSYHGRAWATGVSDKVLLVIAAALAALLLSSGGEPISFLGGLFVGAVLIQLFFHAFHAQPQPDREAPEPRSPLKQMSYAIQDNPGRAWKEMAVYAAVVVGAVALHFLR